jgi:hypothetical protein
MVKLDCRDDVRWKRARTSMEKASSAKVVRTRQEGGQDERLRLEVMGGRRKRASSGWSRPLPAGRSHPSRPPSFVYRAEASSTSSAGVEECPPGGWASARLDDGRCGRCDRRLPSPLPAELASELSARPVFPTSRPGRRHGSQQRGREGEGRTFGDVLDLALVAEALGKAPLLVAAAVLGVPALGWRRRAGPRHGRRGVVHCGQDADGVGSEGGNAGAARR